MHTWYHTSYTRVRTSSRGPCMEEYVYTWYEVMGIIEFDAISIRERVIRVIIDVQILLLLYSYTGTLVV